MRPSRRNSLKRRSTSEPDQPDSPKRLRATVREDSPVVAMPDKINATESRSDVSPYTEEWQKTADMAKAFGETVATTDAIRSILHSYPFSIGLLREIISNSDDAKASRQVFILDRRTHGNTTIHHPYLAATQGPALLAYNDEIIQHEDWRALRRIHDSSKKADTSKIGKYGVGFRASYHITNTPHILSGSNLVILDPQHDFTETGGVQLDIATESETFRDHLATFEPFFPSSDWGKAFQGSIFRLPLRTEASQISDEIASPAKISNLLNDFVREELKVTLLFLRNVTSVEVYEISESGTKTQLATATVDRATVEHHGCYEIRKATVRANVFGSLEEKEWRIVHAPFSDKEAIDELSKRLGGNPTTTLAKHKLSPTIDLAIPLHCSAATKIGRLFTFQPLPLDTEFPIHINALFSLTSSRQNLRNAGEKGIVKGSEDEALIEWNRLLFDTYIPTAWAGLLDILVQHDHVPNIFEAWPSSQAKLQSGDYAYWKDAPFHVARHALTLPIWPILGTGSNSYGAITSLLVDEGMTGDKVLEALGRAGLKLMQPPPYITRILRQHHSSTITILSPGVAHDKLQALIPGLRCLNDADASIILEYLASNDCRYITNLPLVPSVSGARVALTQSGVAHNLLNEIEEELFGAYDPTAVSLRQVPSRVRAELLTRGRQVLNVANLDASKVVKFLAISPYRSHIRETATDVQIRWLDQFWNWSQGSTSASNRGTFNQFYLVPTTSGFQRASDAVIDPQSDNELAGILELLHVSVLDQRLSKESRRALVQLNPSSNIHFLLRSLPTIIDVDLSEDQATYFGAYLVRQLPTACYSYGPLDAGLRTRLRSLPIFPLLSPSPAGPVMHRGSIASTVDVRGVDPSKIPIFPQISSTVYLDLHHMGADILKYIDRKHHSSLSLEEMHDTMLSHFDSQSVEMQVAFMKYLVSHSSAISRRVFDQVATTAFIRTLDGSLRSPRQLIDPQAAIASLYPGVSSSLPDTSQPLLQELVTSLRHLKLFAIDLSLELIRERISYIASGTCSRPADLARRLIALINESRLDCHHLFYLQKVSSNMEWIPTPEGLKSPLGCRDMKSHWGKHDLFDEVMPMVCSDVRISDQLRRAFPWDGQVPFDVLSQQLVKVLNGPQPPYGKVREIVKEIGNRNLTPAQLASLREILTSREWVPVRPHHLQTVTFALLGEMDIPELGFRSIAYDAYSHAKVWTFLKEMGCAECPSKESILEHLNVLHDHDSGPSSPTRTSAIIQFLTWLPSLAPEERTKLFIPDTNGTLEPFQNIRYNDIGPRASLVDIGNNHLAHTSISDELAGTLGLKRLGLSGLENQFDDDLDMGEDLITTIRNRLREYTDSQLLLEFLANASDAGATEFNVLLDHKTAAPAKALISPRCSVFQSVPALVIHNNSVFEGSDFKGILRTGIGGKSDKSDTIGQFGLGALTMFHVTELAMIVSRDQVLFLNPCKVHLSVDRVSLRLPLSQVRKLYGDHLKPLNGLFGFELPEDIYEEYSYNGTLFRLPLRSEAQFLYAEPISRRAVFLQHLVSNFEAVAHDCLLFTSLSSIRCSERKLKISNLWSVSASRSVGTEIEGNIRAHTVAVTSSCTRNCEWRVLSMSVADQQLPAYISSLREKYRLRVPPVIRIAASPSPAPTHTLFSTLPLPIPLSLPVHISASFILASDRRSIRLDEYENIEASYNRWLLETIVPMLYSRLLEDRAEIGNNSPYWPGKSSRSETVISKMVTDAVYKFIATSDAFVFKSKFHEHRLPPHKAHLIEYMHPPVISKVMDKIQPLDVVEPPPFATRKLKDVPQSRISLVTPKYVHAQIMEHSARFDPSELGLGHLQELINFLCEGKNADCLSGLSLLPLEDGSFTKFDTSPDPCFYVAPERATKKAVFNGSRIVHRDLDAEMLLKVEHINIRPISDSNIRILLNDYIAANPLLEPAHAGTQEWIKQFWKVFTSLGISPNSIADYPLIPTLRPDCFVSRNHCLTLSIIVADFQRHELMAACLPQMHFTLVDSTSILRDVRSTLQPLEVSVENVLKKLFDSSTSISTLFNYLEAELRAQFVGWIRSFLRTKNSKYFQLHRDYRNLPLWNNIEGSPLPANEVLMLPQSVSIDHVAPFAPSSTVVYDNLLKSMGIQPPSSLLSILNIPQRLDYEEEEAYRRLLRVLLRHIPDRSSIPVPNSQRLIQDSSTLYSSRDDLFLASFGRDSAKFILPSFRSFESQLEQHGLQTQQGLSIDTFETCLNAFQHAQSNDVVDRAAIIFRIFSEDLPLHASSSSDDAWKVLDKLRFIPRRQSIRPLDGVGDVSRYLAHDIRYLPDIVSPSELVLKEFQPIAWSQRALYLSEPHSRVLMLHPSLSVPSATEVVNHLVVLATDVARDYARNRALIGHLKETYTWLDGNADDAKDALMKCTKHGIPLFLNVDDPTNTEETWEWKRADHILLDDYDTGFLQCPRDFIMPFKSLLIAAGAVSIDYGHESSREESAGEAGQLSFLERFNQMRRKGICTDVHFTFDSVPEPLRAHRAYLAAYATHFKDMFSGFGVETNVASAEDPIVVHVAGFSRRSMECLLDYVYTSEEPELKKEESELALEVLVLAHGWLLTEVQNVMQDIMMRPKMVDPFNLDHVRGIASETMSEELYKYCVRYEQRNSALVKQAREGS